MGALDDLDRPEMLALLAEVSQALSKLASCVEQDEEGNGWLVVAPANLRPANPARSSGDPYSNWSRMDAEDKHWQSMKAEHDEAHRTDRPHVHKEFGIDYGVLHQSHPYTTPPSLDLLADYPPDVR